MEWRSSLVWFGDGDIRRVYTCWRGGRMGEVVRVGDAWHWMVSLDSGGEFCPDESSGGADSLEVAKLAVVEAIREFEGGE